MAATGLVVSAGPAAADGRGGGVEGSWLVDVVNDSDERTRSVLSFAEGDVAVVHDILPAGPPWTGSWESRRATRSAQPCGRGFPGQQGPGSPGGTARLRLRGRQQRGRLTGSFEASLFGPDDAPTGTITDTFSGERIEA